MQLAQDQVMEGELGVATAQNAGSRHLDLGCMVRRSFAAGTVAPPCQEVGYRRSQREIGGVSGLTGVLLPVGRERRASTLAGDHPG